MIMPAFDENDFYLYDSQDPTKLVRFELGNISPGTEVKLTVPQGSCTLPGIERVQDWSQTQTFLIAPRIKDGLFSFQFTDALFNLTDDRSLYPPDANTIIAGLSVAQLFDKRNTFQLANSADAPTVVLKAASGGQAGDIFQVQDASANIGFAIAGDSSANFGGGYILITNGYIGVGSPTCNLDFSLITGSKLITWENLDGTPVLKTAIQTLTNKRINPRIVTMTDATSFTPTADTADVNTQANTQATGTLTANAPSGSPVNGQRLMIRIKSTNIQTFSWNSIYRGGTTLTLPATSSGSSKTDYFEFIYNSTSAKWDIIESLLGY